MLKKAFNIILNFIKKKKKKKKKKKIKNNMEQYDIAVLIVENSIPNKNLYF